jgi:hypothetical protein
MSSFGKLMVFTRFVKNSNIFSSWPMESFFNYLIKMHQKAIAIANFSLLQDVSIRLEERKDDCLSQLKENDM